ncbi:alanine racemase [Niallia endozanthoxylica]|uniref:Alanine racemase n=1 Tax=Niallia endozanthoxylica TaxID=2036016 RepID=A0A5J5H911_9BACI|nr:alanine racemase [Niallia endozanthoxylica]KAA9017101.1 alanine racemase [Niallia endozanthoxylica]
MGAQQFYRDTWAEINLDNIYYNVESLKKILPEKVVLFAVVKANAYGHGDIQAARTAISAGASYAAVALLDEAIALRKKGFTEPVLVLGTSRPENAALAAEYDITLTVFQKEWIDKAKECLKESKPVKLHMKVDSGMGRIGVKTKEELKDVESAIRENSCFYLEGVFTHFATADESDKTYFNQQLASFNELLESFEQRPELVHASNSAASFRYPESYFNGVRLGISMYGLSPSREIETELPYPLKEAFSLRTRLVHVKEIKSGEKVGYGATYEAKAPEWIGTLPIGYADGWIRKLRGKEVLVDGKRVQIAGRICMDQTMIKLPNHLPLGTEVTLIGRQGNEFISVNEIADELETINYEITCMMSNRIPRVYIQGGQIVEVVNGLF